MSTSHEVVEESPEPFEVIDSFLSTNRAYSQALGTAYLAPSVETLSEAGRLVGATREAMNPLYETIFFKGSDLDMETAIDSMMVAIVELGDTAHKINQEKPKNITFDPDFKEKAMADLKEEDESAQIAAGKLCNIYAGYVTSANEALLTSDKVVEFMLATQAREERKKQLMTYGGAMLAAFAGTFLANRLNKK